MEECGEETNTKMYEKCVGPDSQEKATTTTPFCFLAEGDGMVPLVKGAGPTYLGRWPPPREGPSEVCTNSRLFVCPFSRK